MLKESILLLIVSTLLISALNADISSCSSCGNELKSRVLIYSVSLAFFVVVRILCFGRISVNFVPLEPRKPALAPLSF